MTNHNSVLDQTKPIFVVSDFHLGDGRTAFAKQGKDTQFFHFLDHVVKENGQLVVLGDLLELWRFCVEAVVERWHELLDRLDQLKAVYVPGNHDANVGDPEWAQFHPFLNRVHEAFAVERGGKHVRFLHGHEIDPFIEKGLHDNPLYMRCFHMIFDARERMQWLKSETLADFGLGTSESFLRFWHWLTRVSGHVIHPELHAQLAPATRAPLRHMRTHKMLSRYCYHRDEAACDMTIVGHTHRVGRFDNWYYNSGCWVKPSNSFLKIHANAHVEVYDWDHHVPRPNPSIVFES